MIFPVGSASSSTSSTESAASEKLWNRRSAARARALMAIALTGFYRQSPGGYEPGWAPRCSLDLPPVIDRDAAWLARAAGGRVVARATGGSGPRKAVVDSRQVGAGDLFVGLPGSQADGGRFAGAALESGAWGVLVAEEHAQGLSGGAVIAAADPLSALQGVARAWRRELGARVVGVTGSTGKTSTKDILAALLGQ